MDRHETIRATLKRLAPVLRLEPEMRDYAAFTIEADLVKLDTEAPRPIVAADRIEALDRALQRPGVSVHDVLNALELV